MSQFASTEAAQHESQTDDHSESPALFVLPKSMSRETFNRFKAFVETHLGIKMPDVKKTMLQSRLQKRLRTLRIETYEAYYDYVFSDRGRATELAHMIDTITTNKTDFFREPNHFQYLLQTALPTLLKPTASSRQNCFRFWSAGCSTGAEPYTLSMVLSEFQQRRAEFRFSILATDISTRVLKEAALGIYPEAMVDPVPMDLRRRYLLRSKDRSSRRVRVVPELRANIQFRRLNFMDDKFAIRRNADVVFCRNVLIYFERATQEKVINRICRHLEPGGFLFVGHSETLNGLQVPLVQVNPTIYRRVAQR